MRYDEYQAALKALDADIAEQEGLPPSQSIEGPGASFMPIPKAVTRQSDGVVLVNGADLDPEPVRWLWSGWLALGKLHILAGAPGQGKTTIAMAMAATVTMGGRWPDGGKAEPGNVLIWSGEDDPADTLLPRLLASGAKRERCYFVQGSRVDGEVMPFDPARDMATLELEAQKIGGVRLLIVDPVVSAVAGDSHKNGEVRRALQPVVDLASRLGAAAIGISHFSKAGAGGDPVNRVVGSVAFTAVARVVLVAAKVRGEDGEDRRILARGKSNISPDTGGFQYHIEQAEPLPGIEASYIAWGQALDGTARELLAETEEGPNAGDADELRDMLKAELTCEGWTPAQTVFKSLGGAGFSKDQVKRTAQKIGVIKKKSGMVGGWYWRLPGGQVADPDEDDSPEGSTKGAKGALQKEVRSSHPSVRSSVNPSAQDDDSEVF